MVNSARKILFLTSECPYPVQGGEKLRDSQMISLLSEQGSVEVLCFGDPGSMPPQEAPAGVRFQFVPRGRASPFRRIIDAIRPDFVQGYSGGMERAIRDRAKSNALLWVSRACMAQYIPAARSFGFQIVLDQKSLESSLLFDMALSSMRHWPDTLVAAHCAYYEEKFCEAAHCVVASSEIDAARLSKALARIPIQIIPHSLDTSQYAQARAGAGSTLLFHGTLDYAPNIEGLDWFMQEIMPRLTNGMRAEMPKVIVAGANPSTELAQRLQSAGIELRANPPTMLPYLEEAAVVFIPLQRGNGTRLKVLEAMAAGRAVVSTGKGADGLILKPGYDISIADQPDHFASEIARLLREPELRIEMGQHAAASIEAHYDWRSSKPLIQEVLSLLERAPGGKRRIEA